MTTPAAGSPVRLSGQELAEAGWLERIRSELTENILPFWPRHVLDRENGGFHGEISSNLTVLPRADRGAVLATRILWTYSAAARLLDPAYRQTADQLAAYIFAKFWDADEGGLYWMLDFQGNPVADRKQIYAQAFGIYAFADHYRLTRDPLSLDLARKLYGLIEAHGRDPRLGGYLEARSRRWQPLDDVRLSEKDLNSPKSMNTHLHVLEAYTNLMRVWPDAGLEARLRDVLELTLERILDSATGHFRLFFDEQWCSQSDHVSFGHDIEGSWLIVEAAEVLGDPEMLKRAQNASLAMAGAVYEQGLDRDGSVLFEADGAGGLVDDRKHWWVQAEAVIGFYNAYQIGGDVRFRDASRRAWDYIETHVVNRVHGEWHARLTRAGKPLTEADEPESYLVGPWKCPYHNARVCYEMMSRLAK